MAGAAAGKISVADLAALIATDEIDTVVTAVCDMQGRLVGKRVTGQFFVEHCLDHGTHLCTYLLGTDMEMNTPDGYALMNWETGYGDYLNRPDWATLRVIPWLEKTALVLGDLVDETTSQLVPVAPRSILRRQIERAERMGFRPMMASELEFYLLRDTYEEAAEKGWDGLRPVGLVQRGLPAPPGDEGRADLPPAPQSDGPRRRADRVLKGRSRSRPA